MKSIILDVFCVALILLNLHFLNTITDLKHAQKELNGFCANLQQQIGFHQLNFELNSIVSGDSSTDFLLGSRFGRSGFQLSELVKEKPILVCRYSDKMCSSCTQGIFTELIAMRDFFEDTKISLVILSSSAFMGELSIFNRKNDIEFPNYSIDNNYFNWIEDRMTSPYCFILHPDLKISNIYIFDRAFPELNKQYLESVKRLLNH